ncbi:T9SS type A sorting domain-containing protein, partial [candidate division GN15 bacterium]|nr:T9SS type A sorting domain-containing protein [candidate division GN15 bacterium]
TADVRIGSMPYLDGRACLVVLHLNSSKGYEYYLWDGDSFEARSDHSIYADDMGYERAFTHNVVNDTTMHLVFGLNNQMHHLWKHNNNGTGSWNHQTLESSSNTDGMEWYPITTVHGDDLYLFYCKKSSSAAASSMIYYMKWSQTSESWTSPQLVSAGLNGEENVSPNSTPQVPDNSTFIPIFWTSGSYSVQFSKILLSGTGQTDTIPPGWIDDLDAGAGDAQGQIDLEWTAPGDDGALGQADSYDIRYSVDLLDEASWSQATSVADPPQPQASGATELHTLTGLIPGTTYYVGIKVYDEAGNASALSNIDGAEAYNQFGTGDGDVLPVDFVLYQNYPNPFNPSTVIEYYLPRAARVRVAVYNIAGQLVTTLVDEYQAAGRQAVVWDGTNFAGARVASGIYFSSLETNATSSLRKMVLLK